MAELQLPGGMKISVPEGTFNFSVATWLASTTDTAVPKRFVFDNLNFETGSTTLTPESRPTVDSLGGILRAYPAVAVQLEGHTDSTGDPAANNNVEIVVAEKIGTETTTYVRNIYKYYVAYRLTLDAQEQAEKARQQFAPSPRR
jgi:outer membrane protein OmpA-like peptidoglycan-associated protein